MKAPDTTLRSFAGDLARLGALLAAIERLAEDLEDPVGACSSSGFYLVTAIQACVEASRHHLEASTHRLDQMVALGAEPEGGAA